MNTQLFMINEIAGFESDLIFPIDAKPYGFSYEEWAIKFWQWILSIPADNNPITDSTGENCGINQEESPVFFLSFSTSGGAVRECNVPAGKSIMVPVNVVECSFAEFNVKTIEELHTCAREDESSNPLAYLSVNNNEIKDVLSYRVHTEAFNIDLPQNSVIGSSGQTTAVADGYYVILKPLEQGTHIIHFKASLTNPKTGILSYADDLKYTINIR